MHALARPWPPPSLSAFLLTKKPYASGHRHPRRSVLSMAFWQSPDMKIESPRDSQGQFIALRRDGARSQTLLAGKPISPKQAAQAAQEDPPMEHREVENIDHSVDRVSQDTGVFRLCRPCCRSRLCRHGTRESKCVLTGTPLQNLFCALYVAPPALAISCGDVGTRWGSASDTKSAIRAPTTIRHPRCTLHGVCKARSDSPLGLPKHPEP